MAKKSRAKPAPKKAAKPYKLELSPEDARLASEHLSSAFLWDMHPWGHEFWNEVCAELERLGSQPE